MVNDHSTVTFVGKTNRLGNSAFVVASALLALVVVVLGVDRKKVIQRIGELEALALAFDEAFNVGRGTKEHVGLRV